MNKLYTRTLLTLIVLAVIVGGLAYLGSLGKKDTISNYEECVAAGHPVRETFPEQCAVPGGQTFTKEYPEY